MTKNFPLAVILSAYYDRLMCHLDDYREFLDHMNGGDRVWLDGMATFRRQLADELSRILPALAKTEAPPTRSDSGRHTRYLKAMSKIIGFEEAELSPLPPSIRAVAGKP